LARSRCRIQRTRSHNCFALEWEAAPRREIRSRALVRSVFALKSGGDAVSTRHSRVRWAKKLMGKSMEDTRKHYTRARSKNARQSSSVGLIIRQKDPKNLETPFDQLDSFLTPTELFYIRSHFPAPKLDVASYRLCIDG